MWWIKSAPEQGCGGHDLVLDVVVLVDAEVLVAELRFEVLRLVELRLAVLRFLVTREAFLPAALYLA